MTMNTLPHLGGHEFLGSPLRLWHGMVADSIHKHFLSSFVAFGLVSLLAGARPREERRHHLLVDF
jgi:hypothetical protein